MTDPMDGQTAFAEACRLDRAGEEEAAIPFYEAALKGGLPRHERSQALLGLGSSLRNVARHDEAVATLARAVAEFPRDAALRAFLALARYSNHDHKEAMTVLLDLVLEYAPIGAYSRALRLYRDQLE
jgi:tetratricopeptide (TPR) repeat protein